MYCKNCGNELKDGAKFCTNCGAGVGTPNQPAPSDYPSGEKTTLGLVAMILGIAGIVFSFLTGFVGFILGIIAVVLAKKSNNQEGPNSMAKAGKIMGIISIVLGIILFVVAIIVVVVLGAMGFGLYGAL